MEDMKNMVKNIKCSQINEVNSEYEALFSVIHPILTGLALSLKNCRISWRIRKNYIRNIYSLI